MFVMVYHPFRDYTFMIKENSNKNNYNNLEIKTVSSI